MRLVTRLLTVILTCAATAAATGQQIADSNPGILLRSQANLGLRNVSLVAALRQYL